LVKDQEGYVAMQAYPQQVADLIIKAATNLRFA
jgi:hypothetical protein